MPRIAYVNGRYVRHRDAVVHVEDRGYQFADGVYEVCEVRAGRLVDERRHMQRLARSLDELSISWPLSPSAVAVILREVVRLNRIGNGIVYLQVTRGVAPRNHAFPNPAVRPSMVVTARELDRAAMDEKAAHGISVITVPENRWDRVDIKTVGLLPNVLAKQTAKEAGAYEAWFVDRDGFVTEGSSTNAWIVTRDGVLVTRPAEHGILRGVTRSVIFAFAEREGIRLEERAFTLEEAQAAREAFMTGASTIVLPIISVDGKRIANGKPGPVAGKLRSVYHHHAEVAPA
ncbi:MAG: D-amino-acid transaminase [Rhizobiales bacterium]|nr:D-amino-acid transaminase [Hyphomicrobiales bacterium]